MIYTVEQRAGNLDQPEFSIDIDNSVSVDNDIHVNSSEAKKVLPQLLIDKSTVSNRQRGILINQSLKLMLITMSFMMITIFILILLNRKKNPAITFD